MAEEIDGGSGDSEGSGTPSYDIERMVAEQRARNVRIVSYVGVALVAIATAVIPYIVHNSSLGKKENSWLQEKAARVAVVDSLQAEKEKIYNVLDAAIGQTEVIQAEADSLENVLAGRQAAFSALRRNNSIRADSIGVVDTGLNTLRAEQERMNADLQRFSSEIDSLRSIESARADSAGYLDLLIQTYRSKHALEEQGRK
ncbi:MAG: hypothetical protein V1743_02525 [Nanoarchaeota archaeon]